MTESKIERFIRLTAEPSTIHIICAHLANGGSLIDLCQTWQIDYSETILWINRDDELKKQYMEALKAQNEWVIMRILSELRAMAFADRRKIFNSEGGILPPEQWPDDVARCIAGIDVQELFGHEGSGEDKERVQVGYMKKIKLTDKHRSIELMMKNLGMLTDRLEISGKMTLEDLVMGSQKNGQQASDTSSSLSTEASA